MLTFFSILAVNLTSGCCHMKDGMTFFFWGGGAHRESVHFSMVSNSVKLYTGIL